MSAPEMGSLPEHGIDTASHAHLRIRGYTADQMQSYAARKVAAERARLRAALIAMHELDKHRHNYWHCAAVELFGE